MTDDHIDMVRKRPAMWVGTPNEPRAAHELLWEVVANTPAALGDGLRRNRR